MSDRLAKTDEALEALEEFERARLEGRVGASKSGVADSPEPGDEASFNVMRNLQKDDPTWVTKTFVLRSTSDVANVWIEKSLDATVSDAQLVELDEHILYSTPPRSFRPDRGIIENDNDLFGDPPNIDGDDKVDILLHDIEEGEGESCCVLGYVTSVDLNPEPEGNRGNAADILYIDIKEGLNVNGVSGLAWIIAHEYQHLIHFNYQDGPEETFVNEGLSEWASVVNGYFDRRIRYLDRVEEHGTPLTEWDTDTDFYDYERAGLFTTYIADRIGLEATGSIVRAVRHGEFGDSYAVGGEGYDIVMKEHGTSLAEIVAGFHTANFINDTSIDLPYGYLLDERKDIKTPPTVTVDGASATASSYEALELRSGTVRYISWSDVADVALRADIHSLIAPVLIPDLRSRISLRVFMETRDGGRSVATILPGEEVHEFAGDFEQFTLVIVNTTVGSSSAIKFDVAAEWNTSTDSEDEAELPEQFALDQNYPNPFNPSTTISYSLPATTHVRLTVHDALGRVVSTLVDGVRNAGAHEAELSADGWASGVYVYTLETDAFTISRRMVLMK